MDYKKDNSLFVGGAVNAKLETWKSKYFKRQEFACKHGCGFGLNDGDVDLELLQVLEETRIHFGKPIVINSGCRCPYHNSKVGGAESSQHVLGKAADIRIAGIEPIEIYNYFDGKYPKKYGIGLYVKQGFVHIDVRKNKARWNG